MNILVPETIARNSANERSEINPTHVEFSITKGQLVDHWCTSIKADGKFDNLRQFILL